MEIFYSQSNFFFRDLLESMDCAQRSIDVEVYILQDDKIGNALMEALKRASERGVRVRLIVDGVGSRDWAFKKAHLPYPFGMKVCVFRSLPWPFSRFKLSALFDFVSTLQLIWYVNRRTHKKLSIIDGKTVFLGSLNFFEEALEWRECGLMLQAPDFSEVFASFEYSWAIASQRPTLKKPFLRRPRLRYVDNTRIWSNFQFRERVANRKELTQRIENSDNRVWLAQAYFIPPSKILKALVQAARRGVDVRLILSKNSDVRFVKWASLYYYKELLAAGVKIYEYLPALLHAKLISIDQEVMMGSSNFDHRSFHRDLELDVWLSEPSAKCRAEDFLNDCIKNSQALSLENFGDLTWFQKLRAKFILLFKNWL